LPVCKLLAMFMEGCPASYKSAILPYVLISHNCYVNNLTPVRSSAEDLTKMENDLDTILRVCCGKWNNGASVLFNALVTPPSFSCKEPLEIAMTLKSGSVDRAVRRVFEQGLTELSTLPKDVASNVKNVLIGLGIAYLSVCSRDMPGLAQFANDLRSLVALGPEDPAFSFGADRIALSLILSIETPAFNKEVESLLASCFAKSTPFELNPGTKNAIKDAERYISGASGLQKVFILCHSPVVASYLQPSLGNFNAIAAAAGESADKYIVFIRGALAAQPRASQLPTVEGPSGPDPMDDSQKKEQGPNEEEEAGHPLGLPPSEPDDDSDANTNKMN